MPDSSAASVVRPARELDARQLIEALHALRRGPFDTLYWPRYCALVAPLTRARMALVVSRQQAGGDWRLLAASAPEATEFLELWREALASLADRAFDNGFAYAPMRDEQAVNRLFAAVRMGERSDNTLLLLIIPEQERARLNELLLRVQLVADLPPSAPLSGLAQAEAQPPSGVESVHDENPAVAETTPSNARLSPLSGAGGARVLTPEDSVLTELLDLSALVMRERHYGAAVIALVNGVMARLGCALVALGWRQDGYVKIEAISHLDRFERKTEYVNLLEGACEEAIDQECDIVYAGEDPDAGLIIQAHARLQRALGYSQICTLPLHVDGETSDVVLLLAMEQGELTPRELADTHLALGLMLPWLAPLRAGDRWWGARLGGWSRQRLVKLFGPERPLTKLFSLVIAGLLLYGLFGAQIYQIKATSQLGTDSTRLISASYDGFLNQVNATSGDSVKQGALLAALDTRELMQQEVETLADIQRFRAEAMKARANLNLADAEIAGRRLAQVEARLARIRYSLAQSLVYAPFDSVIVEGERKDLLGAPVKKGERLFRLARIEGLYVVLHVPENEIRYVEQDARGELTLLARPDTRIPFAVETLMPVAQVKGQDGNHFVIKAKLLTPPEAWWRPGMSGMARIEAGERNVAWIYSHKAIDALRMTFWF
jgi:hypothetical protein